MNTQLRNRTLYYDGTNQVTPDLVPELFLHGVKPEKIVVTSIDEDIKLFNLLSDLQIGTEKSELDQFDFRWAVPEKYLQIDLDKFLLERAVALGAAYKDRVEKELVQIHSRNLENLFRTLIYVVDTFRENQTIWGVGRGSSCASLALYLIGLHMVDPVKYGISLEEFFHD